MSTRSPEGMDVEHFLSTYGDEAWSNEPFIYCCRQEPQIPAKFYYRCGAAGLQLFPDADRPYQASENSRRGLSGRLQMYIGSIRPNRFLILAAIRVKRQVVALPQHRTNEGADGETYNITKGNMSAVRAAEMTMHHYLDADKNVKRYAPHPESELFQPNQGVEQLLTNMRKVQGLQMLLFDARSWRDDPKYDGGEAPPSNLATRDTTARKTPARATEQSLVIRMSKAGIEQLRAGNPTAYTRLMNLMREAYREENPPAAPPPPAAPVTTPIPTAGSIEVIGSVYRTPNRDGDFEWELRTNKHPMALYLFNDNVKDHNSDRVGGGNAVIRPYVKQMRAAGISTGLSSSSGGYQTLDAGTKIQIDRDISEIKAMLATGKYKQIRFSIDEETGFIGTGIFQVAASVKKYITREIKKLGTYQGPEAIVNVAPATIAGLRAEDRATRAAAAADLVEAVLPRQTRAKTRAAATADQPIANRTRARAQ